VIVGDPSDRGDQLVGGEGLLDCLDIGEVGRDADRITRQKQEGHFPPPQLLGKGQARSAAKDEIENDDVRERWTGEALAGALDRMFQGDRRRARGFEEDCRSRAMIGSSSTTRIETFSRCFRTQRAPFSDWFRSELSEAPEACAFN
jgi:hypothetical protein